MYVQNISTVWIVISCPILIVGFYRRIDPPAATSVIAGVSARQLPGISAPMSISSRPLRHSAESSLIPSPPACPLSHLTLPIALLSIPPFQSSLASMECYSATVATVAHITHHHLTLHIGVSATRGSTLLPLW